MSASGSATRDHLPRCFIEKRKPIVARKGQPPALPWHHRANALADIPDFLQSRDWIEGKDLVALDIHVEQAVVMPQRAFAPE